MKAALLILLVGMSALVMVNAQAQEATTEPDSFRFFDDFNYYSTSQASFSENGWIVRTADGWPGIPGAIWSAESVTLVDDPDQEGNRLIQMTASSDGTTVHQAQFCQSRKFFEGTYATRVRFIDAPVSGPDGDNVVQTFYQISPLAFDLDPDYSELDFEYLPNGGWGMPGNILYVTSWETFRPEPNWLARNTSGSLAESFAGWHTLVMQVGDGVVTYFVDGREIDRHDGDEYPEVPMSLNYNLWFINGGQIESSEPRQYVEQVDWAFHQSNAILSPDEVDAEVESLRSIATYYVNSLPEADPPLESPCNF